MMDESGAPMQALTQGQPQAPQPQGNPLGGLTGAPQGQPPQQAAPRISKDQVVAGLHHLTEFQRKFGPLLNSPLLGKDNIRPKIFDASATLIGEGTMTVPEVMNGIKSLPSDPLGQKKWLEMKLQQAAQAQKKLVSDYIAQGPGPEPQGGAGAWSPDTHREHVSGLMAGYKR